MDELLGTLIPLLMQGADISTILRELSGGNRGASYDGLRAMLHAQYSHAIRRNSLRPSQSDINSGASAFVDTLGINPYSGLGQGLSGALGQMYHFAPDIVGSMIGIPNPSSFFQKMANGAAGISMASGNGQPSIFNPYSVMAAHDNAMGFARTIYGIATDRGDGLRGYNTDFMHGLNFSELGHVAQRMMSSDIPYMDESGRRLDLTDSRDADKFKENIKKLGSKFNEAASMLTKITGSVEEALQFMDKLSGGNFLGGSAEQASQIANKARNMAAAIRVTSAMAGMDPREAYARMNGLQGGIAQAMGLDPSLANQSGFASALTQPAYVGTMAYNMWAAQNPNATEQQKNQAWLGAQFRTTAYFSSTGKDLVSIVSANKHLFSEEQLAKIESDYRMGRPNDSLQMVKDVIGAHKFNAHMQSPAMLQADRMYGDRSLQERLDRAGLEGGMVEAAVGGASTDLSLTLADIDASLNNATGGKGGYSKYNRDAGGTALRDLAVRNGLTKEAVAGMDVRQLRRYLLNRPGLDARIIDRIEKSAEIEDTLSQIRMNIMTSEEEYEARNRLRQEIANATHINDDEKARLDAELTSGTDINLVFEQLYNKNVFSQSQIFDKRKSVMGGRLSGKQAQALSKRLQEQYKFQRVASTPGEWKRADDAEANRVAMANTGVLFNTVSGEKFTKAGSDRDALQALANEAGRLAESGQIVLDGDDANLSKAYGEAARMMVSGIFDGQLGDLKETDENGNVNADYTSAVSNVSNRMMALVGEGKSIRDAFAIALDEISGDEDLGESGRAQIQQWKDQVNDSSSAIYGKLTRRALGSGAISVLQRNTAGAIKNSAYLQDMFAASRSGSDSSRLNAFVMDSNELNASGLAIFERGDDASMGRTLESGMENMFNDLNQSGKAGLGKDVLDHVRMMVSKRTFDAVKAGGEFGDSLQGAFLQSAIDMRTAELMAEKRMLPNEARKQAEQEAKKGNFSGVAKKIMAMANAAKDSLMASMDRVMSDTMGVMQRNTMNAIDAEDISDYVNPLPGESDMAAIARFTKVANARIGQGLLTGVAGDEDGKLSGSLTQGARASLERALGSSLSGMSAKERNAVLKFATESAMSALGSGKSWGDASKAALESIVNNKDLNLNEAQQKRITEAVGKATPQTVVDLLQNTMTSMIGNTVTSSGGVGSLYALAQHNPFQGDKERESAFMEHLKELRDSGRLTVIGEDNDLSVSRAAGSRAALDAAFLGDDGKQFNDEWKQARASEISEYMAKNGADATEATMYVLQEARKGASRSQRKAIDATLASMKDGKRSLTGSYLTGIWKNTAKDATTLMQASASIEAIVSGRSGFSDKDATEAFTSFFSMMQDASVARTMTGDDDKLSQGYSSGIGSMLSDLLGDKASGLDIASISDSAVKNFASFGGKEKDWSKAIGASLESAANAEGMSDDQKKNLLDLAQKVRSGKSVGLEVIRRTLKSYGGVMHQVAADAMQYRDGGYYAAGATKDQNTALMTYAADKAQLDFSAGGYPEGSADAVSGLDKSAADTRQNGLYNAINRGAGSFAREVIESSKAQFDALSQIMQGKGLKGEDGKELKGVGALSIDTLRLAASGADTEEAKKARETVKGRLASANRGQIQIKRDMEFLSALSKHQFGEDDGLSVLSSGKTSAAKAGTDDDWAAVSKIAGREGSMAYEILKTINDFSEALGKLYNEALPVTIKGGNFPS